MLAPAEPGGVSAESIATPPVVLPSPKEPAGWIDVARGRRRRGGRLVIGAVTAVAVAAAVVVAFLAFAQPGRAPSAHAGAHAGRTHAARTGHPASPSPQAQPTPPWLTYQDPSGFAIGIPPGWKPSLTAPEDVQFTGPGQFVLTIEWTTQPQLDALADWQQQAASKAATDGSYRLISLSRVNYRGYNAADWQFSNVPRGGVRVDVIDRTFIVRPGRLSYAIDLSGPASQWPAVYARIWQRLVTSFQPAP